MASLASFTRSAARATSSAYRSLPIRWRLAGGSAVLTGLVLLVFAVVIGAVTESRIRSDFQQQLVYAANDLASKVDFGHGNDAAPCGLDLDYYASAEQAVIRVVYGLQPPICATTGGPHFGLTPLGLSQVKDYEVETAPGPNLAFGTPTYIQYARPLSVVEDSVAKVRLFLFFGVLGGLGLALLAGLAVARRAMRPIAQLTTTASEIARTRDPSIRLSDRVRIEADDEVAELAHTLEGMLRALDEARGETEETLARQRQFVADASHELRTPLTSVLANLELLAEEVEGEAGDAAQAALRSSRRMRRLVADLLLLARADVGREAPRKPLDVSEAVVEAAGELEPVAGEHELSVSAPGPAIVRAAPDELHRVALNLIENALRHTPGGTRVEARVEASGDEVRLIVEDDGPGVPEDLRARVFDRFVRGSGDRRAGGGAFRSGTGLGLAIVRAVAESHGGSVVLDRGTLGGARFTVRLPAAEERATEPAPA